MEGIFAGKEAKCFLFDGGRAWEEETSRAMREFEEDMFRWYRSQTQLSAYYFVGFSKIWLLLPAGKNLKVRPGLEFENQFSRFRNLVLQHRKLWKKEALSYMEELITPA